MSAAYPTWGELEPLRREIYEEVKAALDKLDINYVISYGGMLTAHIFVERPDKESAA